MYSILHLSDLHFTGAESATLWHGQLSNDLKYELKRDRLDAVIVSGDVGTYSLEKEYDEARRFLERLGEEFRLPSDGLILVPGNHDLNWKLAKSGYSLVDRDEYDGYLATARFVEVGSEVIRVLTDEAAHRERFSRFAAFHKRVTGRPYPTAYNEQAVTHHLPSPGLTVLGLNSSWKLDEYETADANIHPGALASALTRIRTDPTLAGCHKLAVWHHPLHSEHEDRIKDHGFMDQLAGAGFSLALHGHVHQAGRLVYAYDAVPDGRQIQVIGAGTFGAPTSEWVDGVPLQYHFLELDERRLVIHSRRRQKINGKWTADPRWEKGPGRDPSSRFEISLPEREIQAPEPPGDSIDIPVLDDRPPEIPPAYRDWISDRCRYMDIDRLRKPGSGVRLELPEVFIPLLAFPPAADQDETGPGDWMPEQRAVDIETLIADGSHLVIGGQPGSGKTTLLKHLTLMVVSGGEAPDELIGRLSVLIQLKELRGEPVLTDPPPTASGAEALMDAYCANLGNGLDIGCIRSFCRTGRALILLDGLDEIEPSDRDRVVHAFADLRTARPGVKVVLAGRPHGIDGAAVDRFGDRKVTIAPLNMDQVESFVQRWFCYIENEAPGTCTKTAGDLLAGMRGHSAIDALKDTPLMLTAICLLYYDGRELPGQRAELSDKFVDNVLHRRFPHDDAVKIRRFLAMLAHEIHLDGRQAIDRKPALDVLGRIYDRERDESETTWRDRLDRLFDWIEPQCGLLFLENGRYRFWHLTFQEFLTADQRVYRERRDYFKAVEGFWDNEWYAEVIRLFVGYLSIQNGGMANEIVRRVLEAADESPFKRWRLAATALENIHVHHREADTVKWAEDRLLSIMRSEAPPPDRADAGRILGWLGDPRDLKEFVPIPAGKYLLSRGKKWIDAFEIGKYPVTNGWFREFIEAGGYKTERYWTEEGRKWLAYTGSELPQSWYERPWNCPNSPVVGICWYEAQAFVQWLTEIDPDGYHYFLPTEDQWEAAAVGFDGRTYPWGHEWSEDHCNSDEIGLEKPSPVGCFEKGSRILNIGSKSISDIAGNVSEWTQSDYHYSHEFKNDFPFEIEIQDVYEKYICSFGKRKESIAKDYVILVEDKKCSIPVQRGGSFLFGREHVHKEYRFRNAAIAGFQVCGMRCARKIAL